MCAFLLDSDLAILIIDRATAMEQLQHFGDFKLWKT
tara:strand:- start:2633 stop:2740 length:108 start_codon:yes stop_codon:yes gene_type:complete